MAFFGVPTLNSGSGFTGFISITGGGGGTPPPPPAFPPVINSPPTATGAIGATFPTYRITATNNPTSFSANVPPPAGLSFTPPDEITGTPAGPTGTTQVSLSATNADGTGTRNLAITINPAPPPPPVIATGQSISGTVGSAITPYPVQNTGGTATSWSATGLPANLVINASTGVISGTPSTAAGSPFTANVTATNAGGSSGAVPLTVTIALPAAPVITAGQSITATAGAAITPYQVVNTGGTATNWSATGLPANLSINASTGIISGTPSSATGSPFTANITATNAGGSSGAVALTVTVTAAAPQVPTITSPLTYSVAPGGTVNYQIAASNPPITAYAATGLPAGVTVNTTSGLISGTAPATVGDTNVTLTATNATGTSAPATLVFRVAAGWEVTNTLPGNVVVIATVATTTAFGPLPNWTGWQPAYQADMTDALYDAPTPADQTVRLFAALPGGGGAETEIPFDNFINPTTSQNPGIRQWGYNSGNNSVYLDGGQNSSGQPIPVRLVKA